MDLGEILNYLPLELPVDISIRSSHVSVYIM